MRFITFILIVLPWSMNAQSLKVQDSTLFDFWVGDWEATWTNSAGQIVKGTNKIVKILDGKVIQENFSFATGKFKGTSISVYNAARQSWHQAWADTQGGYIDLEGDVEGHKRIFKTRVREKDGQKIIQRMAFYNIKHDSFVWDWELSKDGGLTWQLQWRINYVRKTS